MPEQKLVEVWKGDYDKRFFQLDGVGGTHNRPVSPSRVREYGKNIYQLAISPITLIKRNDDTYYIADGQHRIKAISEFGNGRPVEMPATIYTVAEIEKAGRTVPEFISDLNRGARFSRSDRLAVFQDYSKWPEILLEHNLEPKHINSKNVGLTWANIMSARVLADLLQRAGRLDYIGYTATPIEDAWRSYSEAEMRQTAAALEWWLPVAEAAYKVRGIRTLYGAEALAIAMMLHAKYQKQIASGHKSYSSPVNGVLNDPMLPGIKALAKLNLRRAILRSINYKRQGHALELFGVTGRE